MMLLRSLIHIVFIIIPFHTFALDIPDILDLKKKSSIKLDNIKTFIGCDKCCLIKDTRACNLFYNMCITKSHRKALFLFSESNITDLQIIKGLKIVSFRGDLVIIAENDLVYFTEGGYARFKKELLSNVVDLTRLSSDNDISKRYKDARRYMKLHLEEAIKVYDGELYITKNDFNNIDSVLQTYDKALQLRKEIPNIYGDYYREQKEHKEKCIQELLNNTPKELLNNTPIVSNSTLMANGNTAVSGHVTNKFNSLPLVIACVVAIPVSIAIIVGIMICKRKSVAKPSPAPAPSTKLAGNNNAKFSSNKNMVEEHVYEEPYYDVARNAKKSYPYEKTSNINKGSSSGASYIYNDNSEYAPHKSHIYNVLEDEVNKEPFVEIEINKN